MEIASFIVLLFIMFGIFGVYGCLNEIRLLMKNGTITIKNVHSIVTTDEEKNDC